MPHLFSAFNFFAAVSSLLAAFYWYRASQVGDLPNALVGATGWGSRKDQKPNAAVDASQLVKFVKESGRRNTVAAQWSAGAASFMFLSWTLGLFLH